MVVEIIFTNLMDIIYIVLCLIGLLLVGVYYLLPKITAEFSPMYEVIVDVLEYYLEGEEKIRIFPARMRAGEVIILIPKDSQVDEDIEDILLDVGFPMGIIKGLCSSEGCSLRFIINKRDVIGCLSNESKTNPFYNISEEYLGRTKYMAFFNERGISDPIENCLNGSIIVSSDIAYKKGLGDYLSIEVEGRREDVYMIFSNASFRVDFMVRKGEVRIA